MPEALEDRIIAIAALNRKSKTEIARGVLEQAVFGEFTLLMIKNNPVIGIDDAPNVSLDAAITTMATLNGMTPEDFRNHVLRRVLFGEFSMVMSLANDRGGVNPENIG